MKKTARLVSLLLVIIMLTAMLSGCSLDEAKRNYYAFRLGSKNVEKRLAVLDKVSQLDSDAIAPLLEELICEDESDLVKEKAMSIYCSSISENNIAFLLELRTNQNAFIRENAFVQLYNLSLDNADLKESFFIGLDDKEPAVNIVTLEKIKQVAEKNLEFFSTGECENDTSVEVVPILTVLLEKLSESDDQLSQYIISTIAAFCKTECNLQYIEELTFSYNDSPNPDLYSILDTCVEENYISFDYIYESAFLYVYSNPEMLSHKKEYYLDQLYSSANDAGALFAYIPNLLMQDLDYQTESGLVKFLETVDPEALVGLKDIFIDIILGSEFDASAFDFAVYTVDQAIATFDDYSSYTIRYYIKDYWLTAPEDERQAILRYLMDTNVGIMSSLFRDKTLKDNLSSQIVVDTIMSIIYGSHMLYSDNNYASYLDGCIVWDSMNKNYDDGIKNLVLNAYIDSYITESTTVSVTSRYILHALADAAISPADDYIINCLLDEMYNSIDSDPEFSEYIYAALGAIVNRSYGYINDYYFSRSLASTNQTDDICETARGILIYSLNETTHQRMIVFDMLPYYARPYRIKQVRYVIYAEPEDHVVGVYTNGTEAIRRDYYVKVADKLTGELLETKKFAGENPPSSIFSSNGRSSSGVGHVDYEAIEAYILELADKYVARVSLDPLPAQ